MFRSPCVVLILTRFGLRVVVRFKFPLSSPAFAFPFCKTFPVMQKAAVNAAAKAYLYVVFIKTSLKDYFFNIIIAVLL